MRQALEYCAWLVPPFWAYFYLTGKAGRSLHAFLASGIASLIVCGGLFCVIQALEVCTQ